MNITKENLNDFFDKIDATQAAEHKFINDLIDIIHKNRPELLNNFTYDTARSMYYQWKFTELEQRILRLESKK